MINLRNWGARPTEIAGPMPGDDLFDAPPHHRVAVGTRSITIAARPKRVFDFLAQMGFGRAGWYSYDWIDNLGRTSAVDLHDEWMVSKAGDQVPGGPIAFEAVVVDRPNQLVLQVPHRCLGPTCLDFSLAYKLTNEATRSANGTRLVSRVRIAISGPAGSQLAAGMLLADGVMVRRQLIGLKARCERPS